MRHPLTLTHAELAELACNLQDLFYYDEQTYEPNKEVNGADLVDGVSDLLKWSGLAPANDGEERDPEPAFRGRG